MEAIDERGSAITILTAVDLAAQLTKQHDLDGLRTRLRHVWRHILTTPTISFTTDVLRHASQPGVRPAAKLTAALAALGKETTRREVDDAIAAALGVPRSQLTVRGEGIQRGARPAYVEVVYIADAGLELTAARATAAFRAAVAASPGTDYVRLKHVATGVVATWDRLLHDCWRYHPDDDDPVDLPEPTDVDPPWLAAADTLASTGLSADAVVA
jgi:hypothetical protein